jgi:hypothetical protein
MFRKLMFVVMILLFGALFATQYTRTITEKIEVYDNGLAIITRQEKISGEDLPKFYADYYKNMTADQKLFDNFLYEATKEYYFLYGTTPNFSVKDIKFSADKTFTATIVMKVEGLVSYDKDKNRFVIARKRFENNEKLADLLLPKYFESQIEENIFIASFLKSEKNSLVTERTVELVLPEGSKLEEISPAFVSKTQPSSWYVDFGCGNTYKAELKKTEKGFILKETMVINGGAPKNLMDEKSSVNVLQSLKDYTAFEIAFSNEKMKPDALTEPVEHKSEERFFWQLGLFSFTIWPENFDLHHLDNTICTSDCNTEDRYESDHASFTLDRPRMGQNGNVQLELATQEVRSVRFSNDHDQTVAGHQCDWNFGKNLVRRLVHL